MSLGYRRIQRPCSRPGIFGHSRGLPPGSLHQGVELLHQYDATGNRFSTDRFGWPLGDLPAATFDWADGDLLAPAVGPALTATNAPTYGLPTPWQTFAGAEPTCANFDAAYLDSAAYTTPAANEDILLIALAQPISSGGTVTFFISTFAVEGYELRYVFTTMEAQLFVRAVAVNRTSRIATPPAWMLVSAIIDRSGGGNQRLYLNGDLVDTDAALAGAYGTTNIGVGDRPGAGANDNNDVARVMEFRGVGLAATTTDAWHRQLADDVSGIFASQGINGVFARNTGATWQNRNGIWHLGSARMPRAGDSDGIRFGPARTNQAFSNIDPIAADVAAALTWTGAVAPTAVDDNAALTAAGAREWGPNVFQYANTTGGNQWIRMSQQTGDVNPRSFQCLVRRTAGVGAVNLGLYDEVGLAFAAGTAIVDDAYATRTLVHGQVPIATDTLCLQVADATTIRWCAHDMSTGPRCTTPIQNDANAAAAARNADVFTTSDTPGDDHGGFGFDAEPLGWSAAETGGASVMGRAGGGNAMIYVTAAGVWELDLDGTTLITSTASPADGVSQRIEVRWSTGGLMTLAVDGTRWSAAYDGSVQNAGAWELELDGGDMAIRNLTTYRNGSG